jgi:hypothetical protein
MKNTGLPRPLPPLEQLRAGFAYNPETGALTRRETGSPAGWRAAGGYVQVKLKGRFLLAHRVAWALYNGVDPGPLLVDHINRDRADNRACNLRLVDAKGNWANSARPRRPVKVPRPRLQPGRPVQVCGPGPQIRLFPSIRAAAAALGCAPSSIYRYARGLRRPPAGLQVAYAAGP